MTFYAESSAMNAIFIIYMWFKGKQQEKYFFYGSANKRGRVVEVFFLNVQGGQFLHRDRNNRDVTMYISSNVIEEKL